MFYIIILPSNFILDQFIGIIYKNNIIKCVIVNYNSILDMNYILYYFKF